MSAGYGHRPDEAVASNRAARRSPVDRLILIFHITNDVAAPLQANVCLAVGASPLMSKHPAETEELAALSNGFLANLGTPTPDSIETINLGHGKVNLMPPHTFYWHDLIYFV